MATLNACEGRATLKGDSNSIIDLEICTFVMTIFQAEGNKNCPSKISVI